jgi:MFS family permease
MTNGAPVTAHRRWLLAVLLTMLFMYQVDVTIVNVASPSIRADLHASGAQLELVISGYLLAGFPGTVMSSAQQGAGLGG